MEELDDFRRRLEDRYHHLTKSEQRIASFLLSDHDAAVFLSAAEMAERLAVSEATIVRFARSIGYDSFPEMRRALQEIFRARVTPASRLQRKLADLKAGQGHVLQKVIDMELQYLTEAERSVRPAEFDRAVDLLVHGRRLIAFGSGPSRILAELAEIRLRRFGYPTLLLIESGRDMLDKLALLRPDDVMLATGFHRATRELVVAVDRAHSVGCPIVLLTDTLGSNFQGKVDVVLSARRGPVSTFHSLTVPMAILNALILAIAMSKPDESLAALNRLLELRALSGLDIRGAVRD